MATVALVGAGRWGQQLASAFQLEGHRVAWVVDQGASYGGRAFAFGIEAQYTSALNDPLSDPAVGAYVVATPASTHESIALIVLGDVLRVTPQNTS